MRFTACLPSSEVTFDAEDREAALSYARAHYPDLEMVLEGDLILWQRTPMIFMACVGDGECDLHGLAAAMRRKAQEIEGLAEKGMELCQPVMDGIAVMRARSELRRL